MKEILEKHLNSEIGINVEKPFRIDTVKLVAIAESWFTVANEANENIYHVPFLNISKIIEHPGGVTVGGLFKQKRTYPLVVKIGHIVEYLPT